MDKLPEWNVSSPGVEGGGKGSLWCGERVLEREREANGCSVEQCHPWLGGLCRLNGFAVPRQQLDCLFSKYVKHKFVTWITKGQYLKGSLVLKLGLFT